MTKEGGVGAQARSFRSGIATASIGTALPFDVLANDGQVG